MNILIIIVIMSGWASQYDPGIMERTIRVQQHYGHLPERLPSVDGYVAVEDCRRIGQTILARPLGAKRWDRLLITDCSGSKETSRWMLWNNILIEVDHLTAKRWKTVGHGIRIEVGVRTERGLE